MRARKAFKKSATGVAAKPRAKLRKGVANILNKTEKKVNKQLSVTKDKLVPAERSEKIVPAKDARLNASGNRRGMHNRDNPPSSEHMRKLRGMRKLYGTKMPVPVCNTCAYSTNCPSFKPGYECAFVPFLQSHKIDSLDDIMEAMENLVESGMQRMHLAAIMERLSGGAPSAELSEGHAMLFGQLEKLHSIKREGESGPGGGESGEGIIKKLFGGTKILIDATASHQDELKNIEEVLVTDEGSNSHATGTADQELEDEYEAQLKEDEDGPAMKTVNVSGLSPDN